MGTTDHGSAHVRAGSDSGRSATYVLCDHGYLREGWCRECDDLPTQQASLHLSILPSVAIVMVIGLIVTYVLDPDVLLELAIVVSLSIVAILGWIVVVHEHRSGTATSPSRQSQT